MRAWIRTCQECGNIQKDMPQTGEITDAYANRKCKRCKSMALDYGKWIDETPMEDWGPED